MQLSFLAWAANVGRDQLLLLHIRVALLAAGTQCPLREGGPSAAGASLLGGLCSGGSPHAAAGSPHAAAAQGSEHLSMLQLREHSLLTCMAYLLSPLQASRSDSHNMACLWTAAHMLRHAQQGWLPTWHLLNQPGGPVGA